jgi:hypothetical protein
MWFYRLKWLGQSANVHNSVEFLNSLKYVVFWEFSCLPFLFSPNKYFCTRPALLFSSKQYYLVSLSPSTMFTNFLISVRRFRPYIGPQAIQMKTGKKMYKIRNMKQPAITLLYVTRWCPLATTCGYTQSHLVVEAEIISCWKWLLPCSRAPNKRCDLWSDFSVQ